MEKILLLSTSNSNARLPGVVNRREIWIMLALLVVLIAGSEGLLRLRSFRPALADSMMLWSMNRVKAQGDRVLVILGTSRSLLGFDPDVFKEIFQDYQIIHLGIDGQSPIAVLDDLAHDPAFRGIIVCETAEYLMNVDKNSQARPWVDYFRNTYSRRGSMDERFNAWVKRHIQEGWVIASPAFGLSRLLVYPPGNTYDFMRPNRYRPSYYLEMKPDQLAKLRDNRMRRSKKLIRASTEEDRVAFEEFAQRNLRAMNESLASRGGAILLVRPPVDEELDRLIEQNWPRKDFWDPIMAWSGAITIHANDVWGFSRFECPDASHLDATVAPLFSRELATLIHEKLSNSGRF
jgi:hypothetical protein